MYKARHGGLPRPDDARRAVSRAGIPLSAPQTWVAAVWLLQGGNAGALQ